MDKNRVTNKSNQAENSSLGILSMDNMKVFGETSRNSSITERLNAERLKAFETLKKTHKSDFFKKPYSSSNKENVISLNNTPKLDNTDYVPYRRPNTINISDLVTDETIDLETSSCPPSASKDSKISFEPAEITGRSTLHRRDLKQQYITKASVASSRLSVNDILASSFAPKARNLCESLRDHTLSGASSTASSSFTSYNVSHSLPRTADMSLSKAFGSEVSFGAAVANNGFSFLGGCNEDNSAYSSEDFAPGELMQSKLLMDEISWAQQYAAIPAAALSEKAKAIASRSSVITSNPFDSPSASNSMIASDPNFSVGTFFNMRSDDLCNIVKARSPDKCRTPVPLVEEDDNTVSTTTSTSDFNTQSSVLLTPKIDNRTYSIVTGNAIALEKHESKDSGNATDNSYLLSMSAIDRALCNLDIHTDDSGSEIIDQLLNKAKTSEKCQKKTKSSEIVQKQNVERNGEVKSYDVNIEQRVNSILENKENLDPKTLSSGQLSETLSFTDSILNTSDMRKLHQTSISQARSPLSPIENVHPSIKVTDEVAEEGDVDEWPSTPIKSPNRRVRRTKSPCDVSSKYSASPTDAKTPINNRTNSATLVKTKSLCSTRLDSDKDGISEPDFRVSPNLSKSNGTRGQIRNNTLSVCSSRSGSPGVFDNSPISSPRSCMSSQASSPSGCCRSPQLDSTSSSDRRYLNVGSAYKTASSPVISESGNKYTSVPVVRTSSTVSVKNGVGAAGRSSSRCSNSSEFSHRDGKIIPLKVTTMELSWGSTKLRTDLRKSMQVKNISNKRLIVRVEVHGPGFQIVNAQSSTLNLQSQECRSIIINFCPTVTGVAIGILSFYSPVGTPTSNSPFLEIPLYGYGGHASITPQNILKGPVGSAFLPIGDLRELSRPLERSFKIYNKGPLLGFAIVCIDSIGLHMPRLCDAFEIRPNRMLIAPGNAAKVRIVFRPKRDDIKKIIKKISNVLTLVNMRIICGDEANRQRMRRLVGRMTLEERSKIASNSLDKLWTEFPNEVEMSELEAFTERPDVTIDLLTSMRIHEIAITINHDSLEETMESSTLVFPEGDETVLFRTVCAASPTPQQMLDPVDELLEGTITAIEEQAVSSTREGSWSVRPNFVEFDFVTKRRQERVSLLIRNNYKSRQYFEVICNYKDLLRFTPNEGYVEPDGGQIEIEINSKYEKPPANFSSTDVIIMVYMENERVTVPVKFPEDNFLGNR